MKANQFEQRKGRAVVLIVVLASLVLLSILVVAFVSSVGTELRSSKVYSNGSSVKLLAQSAINLVQSEINDATHDGALCWTSQPGMIRTFDSNGTPVKYYKLYSDDAMVSTGAFDSASGVPPEDWYNRKGVYVDLNEPVAVMDTTGSMSNHFPIVPGDPSDLTDYTPTPLGIGNVKAIGPLATYGSTTIPQVAGFWIQSPNSAPNPGPKKAPLQPGSVNQAPMPVKWLYVLRDGSIVVPDSVPSGGTTTFSGQQPNNDMKEIVGRVAFWTDDETSKVNINTAGEGASRVDGSGNFYSSVWDTPRFKIGTASEPGDPSTMASSQPVQDEFQRYPGHPATVCLSAALGNLVTDPANTAGLSYPENIFPLTPRISRGGSKSGSVPVTATLSPLPLRTDRLYDTVDEFMFDQNRTPNSTHLKEPASLDQTKIEKAKFFLTASSRAPDVNLFNQPRISMWPVSSAGETMPNRSPKDQLIAFCTTINGAPYYFQRLDPNDPFVDLPANAGPTGLARNRQLLEYLRHTLSRPVPGFGGSLGNKYNLPDQVAGSQIPGGTQESDQILTEVFDYIRATNLKDQSMAVTSGSPATTTNPVTPYTTTLVTRPTTIGAWAHKLEGGSGQVVPIQDQTYKTRGFGRFPTVQQAGLIFYASKDNGASPPLASKMRALFVLQFFDPAMGFPWNTPCYRVEITGLTRFTWDGTTKMFDSDPGILPNGDTSGWNLHSLLGGMQGWRRFCAEARSPDETTPSNYLNYTSLFSNAYPPDTNPPSNVSYIANPGPGLTALKFTGGPVTVKIYKNNPGTDGGTVDTNTLIQSLTFDIPSAPPAGFPLPAISTTTPANGIPNHAIAWEKWSSRWASQSDNGGFGEIISTNDVIRTVVATPGDMRLIAARTIIDDTLNSSPAKQFFQKHPRYNEATERMAHCLTTSNGQTEFHGSMTIGRTGGMLVRLTGPYYDGYNPSGYLSKFGRNYGHEYHGMDTSLFWSDVPTNNGVFVGGSGTIPGDWDNGLPSLKDGAYINKPDEGDIYKATGYTPYYNDSYGARAVGETFFSPNRMIPSPGMLGSLPTGVLSNRPWQTLLFRPGPAGHPGLGTSLVLPTSTSIAGTDQGPPYTSLPSTATITQGPPDHLLLDLFTMPVVEPYAISEPLATAGRVNMNYQIVPFTYITRNTAIQAALRAAQVIAVPDADAAKYKYASFISPAPTASAPYRQNVDILKTLTQFEARFGRNDVFRAPSEICSIDLIPANYTGVVPPTRASMDAYWSTRRLTGDNSRERPYTNLYPLLTTKSNTFTIHFRVQTLKKIKSPTANPAVWKEGFDQVTGEYRGSQTIERFVDANGAVDAGGNPLPNFADPVNYGRTLNPYYKFRVVSTRQFAP